MRYNATWVNFIYLCLFRKNKLVGIMIIYEQVTFISKILKYKYFENIICQ